jgi:hypothetical protein
LSLAESSGGKRNRQAGKASVASDGTASLSTLVPPNQVGYLGQSVSSALAQANSTVRKLQDSFIENFPLVFCDILKTDNEVAQKGRIPTTPARFTIEDIVGDV